MDRHCLRHYRITEWLRHGLEPHQVQYLAGHRYLSTTMGYVHIIHRHLGEAVRKAQAGEAQEKQA